MRDSPLASASSSTAASAAGAGIRRTDTARILFCCLLHIYVANGRNRPGTVSFQCPDGPSELCCGLTPPLDDLAMDHTLAGPFAAGGTQTAHGESKARATDVHLLTPLSFRHGPLMQRKAPPAGKEKNAA